MQTSCVVASYLTAKPDDRNERIKTTTFDNDFDLDLDEWITVNDSMLREFGPDTNPPGDSLRFEAPGFRPRSP